MSRRYALMKRRRGDYFLLSNDRRTLWRVVRYREDGSVYRGDPADGEMIVGWYWCLDRLHEDRADGRKLVERDADGEIVALRDPSDSTWQYATWDCYVTCNETRREALAEIGHDT